MTAKLELQDLAKRFDEVEAVRGLSLSLAGGEYAEAYGQNARARELYSFMKSMETYREVLGADTTLVFSTEGDLFRFLTDASGKR